MSREWPREIETRRLLLRRWVDEDAESLFAMNTDPRVMEHFPGIYSREETLAMVARIIDHFDNHGFGLWAIEVRQRTRFAGFVGITHPRFESHFTPCVEIGWRLAAEHWGNGYATEAARASLAFGFDYVGLDSIVSMTVSANVRSRRVMEKIGMTRDPRDDFDHPLIAEGHPLRRHVLYRINRPHHDRA